MEVVRWGMEAVRWGRGMEGESAEQNKNYCNSEKHHKS